MVDSVISVPATTQVTAFTAVSALPGSGDTTPFSTGWYQFVNTEIIIALSGSATSVVAVIERSAVNPKGKITGTNRLQGPLASPADAGGLSGNLSGGIPPNIYKERGVGWWRVRVTTINGGDCVASLSGMGVPPN